MESYSRREYEDEVQKDMYGEYADYNVHGIVLRMRRIESGRFLMGSPEDEPWRNNDENRHEVILTEGFWMAETACTQELWESVIDANPSCFKGKKRPVETVSWVNCGEFIDRINSRIPGLEFRLPTEAEWEYACRAGTETPFSFGDIVTTDQVNYNYDGDFPYNGTESGEYREETVDVRSLPANAWGLYEMHGNCSEWCSDWYGEYPTREAVDPTGPASGEDRVLRGGHWLDAAASVRSALRSRSLPDACDDIIGFRLARGQCLEAEPTKRQE